MDKPEIKRVTLNVTADDIYTKLHQNEAIIRCYNHCIIAINAKLYDEPKAINTFNFRNEIPFKLLSDNSRKQLLRDLTKTLTDAGFDIKVGGKCFSNTGVINVHVRKLILEQEIEEIRNQGK